MRIVFMGTPDFAAEVLNRILAQGYQIVGIYCQPDKPKGRQLDPAPPPVKSCACTQLPEVEIYQPRKLGPKSLARLQELAPDLVVVAAYGKILPKAFLETPRLGCVNIHASLLPRYRGAAPIQWAIANGEPRTGVTLMQMNEGLDTGDILAQDDTAILPEDTGETLHDRLSVLGGDLLARCIPRLEAGQLQGIPQDDSQATWAPPLAKEDGQIQWEMPAQAIANRIRAFHPWPGTFTGLRDRFIKVFPFAQPLAEPSSAAPGTILAIARDSIKVACGQNTLQLACLQMAGKRRHQAHEFASGLHLQPGECFHPVPLGTA